MIAVQPPEYFPRLEYMALIQRVDHFVLGNTFPYQRQSFQNRIKLRSPQGWHWITIPVFGNRDGAPLPEVELQTGGRWREKHWRSFLYNYRTTLYFEHLKASFRPFFERAWERLGPCVSRSVELLVDLFGLQTPITRASTLDGRPDTTAGVARALGAETLLAPSGNAPESLPETTEMHAIGYDHPTYRQNFEGFEPGMSAADLMFNYGPEARRILAKGRTAPPEDHPSI